MQKAAPDKMFIPAPPEAELRVQRVPVHEEEHAREGLSLAARSRAADRDGARAHRPGAAPIDRMLALS